MSNALAIASVTYVIKDLLNDGVINSDLTGTIGEEVIISSLPPGEIDISSRRQQSQLNLFLYRVTPNTGWRNVNLPSHDASGQRINNPFLALDLHYLLTAFGKDELHAEILLGYGMQILHENNVLARQAIRTSLQTSENVPGKGLPDALKILSTSELAEQIELIKIVPVTLSTDEISKLWTAFQMKYRPSTAYLASVVLIESKKSTKAPLPVKKGLLYVKPFGKPEIEKILSQKKENDPILENQKIHYDYNLVLRGKDLSGENVKTRIGSQLVLPSKTSDNQIVVAIPPRLKSGINSVQVIHEYSMGSPPQLHKGIESNIAAFVLSPFITDNPVFNKDKSTVEFTVQPAVYENQRVVLFLNRLKDTLDDVEPYYSYSFTLPPEELLYGPLNKLEIPVSSVKNGNYLIRVRIDGAESPLSDTFDAPKVEIK